MPELRYFLSQSAQAAGVTFTAPRSLDAGFDLRCSESVSIPAGQSALIPTGLFLAIPPGWVGLVRDRSSVAMRGGVSAAGVIDSGYRGEVKVLLYNLGSAALRFEVGEKVAQCVMVPHLDGSELVAATSLDELGDTARGSGGFGSTGR